MRSKPTRRIAAALGLAVIFTGVSAPPSLAAPVDDLVVSLPGMPMEPDLVAATGDSLVNFESSDDTDVVTVTTDRGANWHEATKDLRNIERTVNGKVFYQAPAASAHTNLYTYDLASWSITSMVTFPAYRLEAVGEDYVVYGTNGSDEEEPTSLAAAPVGDPTGAADLTIPARSRNRLGILVGAGSRGVAVSRSLTSRAGYGYLDVVSLTGGDAGYASEPLPGLVAAAIAGQRVYYVLGTSTNVRLCQRSLESAEAWLAPSCLTLKSGDFRTAFGDGTLVAGPSWAGFNLWYGDDVFAGGYIADWSTATPKVIALKASGAVTRVKLPTPVNDLDRPLVIAYTTYTATDQSGYLAKVQSNGALTRVAEWPTVPVQPDQLSLSATKMAGVDARGTGTAWLRKLADPGTEQGLSSHGLDAFVSAGRAAVNSTTGLVLSDQGKQVAKLSALKYLWQLSGPYLLGQAPKASKMTVLAGTKPVTFAAADYPLAIFGSRVAAIDANSWEVRIYDVASGKPEHVRSVELDLDYEFADLAMWGDHLAITGYFGDDSTEVRIWDYFNESELPWSESAGAQVAGLSDNVALVIRDNEEFELLNLETMESEGLGDSAEGPLPAFDGAGRILYATETKLVVHQIPFAGTSKPRALWTSVAASFNSFAGETAPWKVSVDATKPLAGGELELRGLDALSGTSVRVPVDASADGSLRIAWDGKLAGNPAPAGVYEWELLGLDGLKSISGIATVNGRVTVTNTKVAYPQAIPLLNNLKPATDDVLTVDPGALPGDAEVKIQWYRDTTPIPGAIDPAYEVTASDVGRTIKAKVSFAKSTGYLDASKYSKVTAPVAKATITPAPIPVLDDTTPIVDQPVTGTIGTWGPDPVALAYQWYRVSSSGKSYAISKANAPVFNPTGGEVGYKLKLKVTGTRSGYKTKTVYSALTGKVAKAVFTSVNDPTITGSVKLGMPLTAVPGATEPSAKATYQWYRGTSAISGATANVYKTTSSDVGKQLKVRVTHTRSGYRTVQPRYSALTAPIEAGLVAVTPKLDDTTPAVGQVLRITDATGIGDWVPADVTPAYQWYQGSSLISGATSATYEVRSADVGHPIKVKVAGSKDGYVSVAKTSAASAKVAKGVFTSKPVPTIDGTVAGIARVGETLEAVTAGWTPTPTSFTYVWYRSGVAISGQTKASYLLIAADQGRTITVKVTAIRAGFTSASATSLPTGAILGV